MCWPPLIIPGNASELKELIGPSVQLTGPYANQLLQRRKPASSHTR